MTNHQQQMLQLTKHWTAQLAPWADGAKRNLDNGLDSNAVLAELKLASGTVKQCAAAFGVNL